MDLHLDFHAIVDADITVKKGHDLAHDLQDVLREEIPGLENILVHNEPNVCDLAVRTSFSGNGSDA